MTKPHEVTVTREEEMIANDTAIRHGMKYALAAFLADRVPDAMDAGDDDYSKQALKANAHNALRDAVLKGPQG